MMNWFALRAVVEQGAGMTLEQRAWCLAQITGSHRSALHPSVPEEADDKALADCLLRAWYQETRCSCEESIPS